MIPGIGTIIGLGGGVIKDVIQIFTDRSNKKLEAELEVKNFKEKQDIMLNFEKEKGNLNLQTAQVERDTEGFKTQGIKAQSDSLTIIEQEKTTQSWFNAVKDATSYVQGSGSFVNFSNFIIAFIRPAISIYLLWFLYEIYKGNISNSPELMQGFIEYILTFTETIISFWFYARSMDKASIFKKKV